MGIQLNGSSGADIISSSDGTITIDGTSTVSNPIVTDTITISDKISHTGDSNTHIRFAGDDTVTVETAGSERIRITSGGHLGIGDNNPDTRLTVKAATGTDVVGKFTSTDDKAWIQFRDNSTTDTGVMIGAEGDALMLRAGSNERLRITSGGSVNIGTGERTQTARKLNVYGGAIRATQTSNGNTMEVFAHTTTNQSFGLLCSAGTSSADQNAMFRNASGTTILKIRGDGNIGIGTDIPGSQLHLYSATPGIRLTDTDTSGPIHTNIDGASGYLTLDVGSVHRDVIISSVNQSNEIARFEGDGNVLIGGNIKTNNISGHNIVHNGAFNIAQRGVGLTTTTAGFQTVDRWRLSYGGNSAPIWQKHIALTSGAPYDAGFRYSYQIHSIGHSGNNQAYCYVVQSIEARDIANSGWDYTSSSSYINLSFWVKATVAQNYLVYLHTNDSTIKEYCFLVNLAADTWTKVTKAIPGNSGIVMNNDNGVGLQIWFAAYLGDHYTSGSTVETWQTHAGYTSRPDMGSTWWTQSNALFEITGVQLELGSTDTPFEHRPYSEEIALCQRFFVAWPPRSGGTPAWPIYTGGNQASAYIWIPYTMRTIPTPTDKGTGTSTTTGYAYNNNGQGVSSRYANNVSPTLSCGGENGHYSLKMNFGAYGSGGHEADVASWNGTGPGIFLSAEI